MKRIIFTNRINRLETCWDWSEKQPLHCIIPKDTRQTENVARFLRGRPGVIWVDRDRLFQERRDRFEQDYVEFMAQLSINNHSFMWWSLDFTSKNPLSTDLIFKVFCFLCLADLVNKLSADLLVITDDLHLCRQVLAWSEEKEIEVTEDILKKQDWLRLLGPAELCFDLFRLMLYHHWAKQICRWKPEAGVKYAVITSLINRQSFQGDDHYRDTYFGELQNFFEHEKIPVFLFAKFIGKWRDYRRLVQKTARQVNCVPVDYYLSYAGLVKCWLICIYYYFFTPGIRGPVAMYGCDLGYLLKQAAGDSFRRDTALWNIREYYTVRALMDKVRLGRFLYPFENRGFEKMMLLGIKSMSSKVRTCGFQHAAITHKHTNFLMTEEEIKITPLPDEIITSGNITRKFLIQTGNFPADKVRVGCALRQNPGFPLKARPQGMQNKGKIMVILSESVEEYVRTLIFLNKAFAGNEEINLTLRAHPTIPLENALRHGPPIDFRYVEQNGIALEEALKDVSLLIYTSSSIGLDAISQGIPVIFLDLGDFLDPDPLSLLDTFKWRVQEPQQLPPTIRAIENLSEEEYRQARAAAKVFADDYFVPVDNDRLQVFLGSPILLP